MTWNGTFSSTRTFASPFECYYVRVIFIVLYGSVFTICILGKLLIHISTFLWYLLFFCCFFFNINRRCNRRHVHMIWYLPDYALYWYCTTNSKSCWVFYDDLISTEEWKVLRKPLKRLQLQSNPYLSHFY